MFALEQPRLPASDIPRTHDERIVYPWPAVKVGIFHCWPDDIRWKRPNHVREGHVIAFPGRAVEIRQDGDRARTTDDLRIVLYNREQAYRRRLVSPDGDHCAYLIVAPEVLDDALSDGGDPRANPETRPFTVPVAPSGRAQHLEMQLIVRAIRFGADDLDIQERLLRLVGRVIRGLRHGQAASSRAPRARRSGTRDAREELVERARAIAGRDLERSLTLERVARELSVSVFHLSRVFRQETGIGLHAFRDQLRLRRCLPSVLDRSTRLTDVAMALGYATPSHFTDRFRAVYGVAPSHLRKLASLEPGADMPTTSN